jgi:hypothetical protein
MKFQVPQFIEVEDKIFWHLTLKQFIYLTGGGGLSLIILMVLPKFLAVVLIVPVISFSLALAFYKVNNRPFIIVVEAALKYLFNDKLYIWRKVEQPVAPTVAEKKVEDTSAAFMPRFSDSKLKDMNWALSAKVANPAADSDETT